MVARSASEPLRLHRMNNDNTKTKACTKTETPKDALSLNETAYLLNQCLEAALRLGRDLHGALEGEDDKLAVVLLEETNLVPKLADLCHLAARINHAVNAMPGSDPEF